MKKSVFNIAATLTISAGLLILSGCSGAKEQLGLAKKKPDEFAVIQRAPLELPPDYSLRPPRPGAERPQEQVSAGEPRKTVFGAEQKKKNAPDSGESALLQQAGASNAEPGIRDIVDQETQTIQPKDAPVADRFLNVIGLGDKNAEKAASSVVDAEAEAARIRSNNEKGAPVTEGDTPTVED